MTVPRIVCPHCGLALMFWRVINSRVTASGQQRVQIRACPDHPQVREGAVVVAMDLTKARRFVNRVRNRVRRRGTTPKGPQPMVTP